MRKTVLAVMAAGSVFAITAAGATGLTITSGSDSVHVTTSGQATVTGTRCNTIDSVTYEYGTDNQTLTDVTLSTASAACAGLTATVTVNGNAFDAPTAFPGSPTEGVYVIHLTDTETVNSGSNAVAVSIT